MYVGSSCSLAQRLIGYFKGTHRDVGKFIPLLRKEGLNAFSLQVIPLTVNYSNYQELSIEQYFLLQSKFNLNTLRVVNKISGSRSKTVYMYTKDFSKLIYSSYIQEDFIFKLKIHHSIINNNSVYLDKYVFTHQPVFSETAQNCNLSIEDVIIMLDKERLEEKGKKVYLISESKDRDIKSFNSIKDCIDFLNTIAPSNKTTLYRKIGTGKPYQGYICKLKDEEITRKSIAVKVTHMPSGSVVTYSTIRKAALSFSPDINTTGPTIKAYIESGKLFKGIYKIEYCK